MNDPNDVIKQPGEGTDGITRWKRRVPRSTAKNIRLTAQEQTEVMTALRFLHDWRTKQVENAESRSSLKRIVGLDIPELEKLNFGIRAKLNGLKLPKDL